MFYPNLTTPAATRRTLSTFRGYNRNQKIGDGEFAQMLNLTSDHYPLLSPRTPRACYRRAIAPQGLISKQQLCYADAEDFYIGDKKVEGLKLCAACDSCQNKGACAQYAPGKTRCKKQMVSMGAYVLIFPDKKWVCAAPEDLTFGDMEAEVTAEAAVTLCDGAGKDFEKVTFSKPSAPADGALWLDKNTAALYQWSENSQSWTAVETFLKLTAASIGADFSQYDGVILSGISEGVDGATTLWLTDRDFVVVAGFLPALSQTAGVTLKRQIPLMDFVTVCSNRLWGCRYGKDLSGNFVNEIYASKLGDFKNFSCFMGISTDSGVLNLGSDGPFTGAVTHLDHPLFFKENMLHKIYVSDTGAHSVTDTPCLGVQEGCGESLATVSGVLYYMGRGAVCAYDGSLPTEISQDLATLTCQSAWGGAAKGKYYLCLKNGGQTELLVYDTRKNMWHKEDDLPVNGFCPHKDTLYAMTKTEIWDLLGGDEEGVFWSAETGDIGGFSPDSKYLSKLTVRLSLAADADIYFYVRYDFSDQWELLYGLTAKPMGSYQIPLRPKRCDTLRLRMEGVGDIKIHAITKRYEAGGESL